MRFTLKFRLVFWFPLVDSVGTAHQSLACSVVDVEIVVASYNLEIELTWVCRS